MLLQRKQRQKWTDRVSKVFLYIKKSFVLKKKTEQNRNDKKYSQTGTTVKFLTNHEGARATAIMLRSIAARPSWRSPVIVVKKATEITSPALRVNN